MYQENLVKTFVHLENKQERIFLPIQLRIEVQKSLLDGATRNRNVISNMNQEVPKNEIINIKN
jgi:hypothetical protein